MLAVLVVPPSLLLLLLVLLAALLVLLALVLDLLPLLLLHVHRLRPLPRAADPPAPPQHWNPHGKTHGNCGDAECHAGDLGNITAGADGVAKGEVSSAVVRLDGEFTVVGRACMVHADAVHISQGSCLLLTVGCCGPVDSVSNPCCSSLSNP